MSQSRRVTTSTIREQHRVVADPRTPRNPFAKGVYHVRTHVYKIEFLGRTSPVLFVNGQTGEHHWMGKLES